MTFASLRALHAIFGNALDEIERVYALHSADCNSPATPGRIPHPYASPPSTPGTSQPAFTKTAAHSRILDFPSLDQPCDPNSPNEALTSDPAVIIAIGNIVSAAGQIAAIVQNPFLTLCDASMGYHLPSCLRLLESSHTVEILRDAANDGMHVSEIASRNGVEKGKLAHILRLLCTHHILREISPDVFGLNRISSLIDSGKSFHEIRAFERTGRPEWKYRDTDGIAAFVGLCTDELFKSSAYMAEAFLLSPSVQTRLARDPTRAPFCYAFGCAAEDDPNITTSGASPTCKKEGVDYFGWLEGEGYHPSLGSLGMGVAAQLRRGQAARDRFDSSHPRAPLQKQSEHSNANQYRLERFGKAMTGTGSWEAPGGVLNAFPWEELPKGSVIVDVGGGIGSTTMVLATTLSFRHQSFLPSSPSSPQGHSNRIQTGAQSASHDYKDMGFKFIIQDREVVCEMGEKAWNERCPSFLEERIVSFQVHDFFTPQPIRNAAIFYLRVILHDWPDEFAQRILFQLREAATPQTKLVIADFVLPLACADDTGATTGSLGDRYVGAIAGAESRLAPAPLLANLGKASAIAYWMDLTMQVIFNGQERTLREVVTLAASAGWKVTRVTRGPGSLFSHIIAEPDIVPEVLRTTPSNEKKASGAFSGTRSAAPTVECQKYPIRDLVENERKTLIQRSTFSRSGTPTFGSRANLPSAQDARHRFGARLRSSISSRFSSLKPPANHEANPSNQSTIDLTTRKRKPSTLSFFSQSLSPPAATKPMPSPRQNHFIVSRPNDNSVHALTPPRPRRITHSSSFHHSKPSIISNPDMGFPSTPTHSRQSSMNGCQPPSTVPVVRRRASCAQLTSSPSYTPVPPVPTLPTTNLLGSPVTIKQGRMKRPTLQERKSGSPVGDGRESIQSKTPPSQILLGQKATNSGPREPQDPIPDRPVDSPSARREDSFIETQEGERSPRVRRANKMGMVLAAAARIEKGLFRNTSP